MWKPVLEFQDDTLSRETSCNTSRARRNDLWRDKLWKVHTQGHDYPNLSMSVPVTYSVCWRDEVTLKGGSPPRLMAGGTMGGRQHCPVSLWVSDSPVAGCLCHWYIDPPRPPINHTILRLKLESCAHFPPENCCLWVQIKVPLKYTVIYTKNEGDVVKYNFFLPNLTCTGSTSPSRASLSTLLSPVGSWRFGGLSPPQPWVSVSTWVEVVPLRFEREAAELTNMPS